MSLFFENLVNFATNNHASDIHLAVNTKPAIRVDGEIEWCEDYHILTENDILLIINRLLEKNQIETFYKTKELDFSFTYGMADNRQRFRGNVFFEKGFPAVVLRIINREIKSIEELYLPDALYKIANKNRGLFIVTGPTGSGKSTTLASIVQRLNITRALNIITIEDPIEYIYDSKKSMVRQREIGRDTKSFSEAVVGALREDPDVILIGELRDLRTISAAITAAETGHLVLTTLHTQDASQSIDRLIDVFPPYQQQQIRIQLSSTLLGILSQQLVTLSFDKGRRAATELLLANSAIRNHIREAKTSQIRNTIQTGLSSGMHTMDQDLARLFREGIITEDEAYKCSYDVQELKRNITKTK